MVEAKMSVALSSSLLLLCVTLSGGFFFGRVSPVDPYIEVGKDLELTCKVDRTQINCSAEDLSFFHNTAMIPSEYVTVLNISSVKLVYPNLTLSHRGTYNCVCSYNKTWISGQSVIVGFKPDKPKNLTCISENFNKMECTWDPGRDTHLHTKYYLYWTVETIFPPHEELKCPHFPCQCSVYLSKYSCAFPKLGVQFFRFANYTINVGVHSLLGNSLETFHIVPNLKIVKPDPIASIDTMAINSTALRITHRTASGLRYLRRIGFIYSISYKSKWDAREQVLERRTNSFTGGAESVDTVISGLQEYTQYHIKISYKPNMNGGYWSDPKEITSDFTAQQVPEISPEIVPGGYIDDPVRRHLCEVINGTDVCSGKDCRLVYFQWKEIPDIQQNGIILGYVLELRSQGSVEFYYTKSCCSCGISLQKETKYTLYLRAKTVVGPSVQPSHLILPKKKPSAVRGIVPIWDSDKEQVTLSWKAPVYNVTGYTIYMCDDDRDYTEVVCQAGHLTWYNVSSAVTQYTIYNITKKNRFAMSVEMSSVSSGMTFPECKKTFLHDARSKPPKVDPSSSESLTSTSISVKWKDIGCTSTAYINMYQICLMNNDKCTTSVNSTSNTVTITDLKPYTEYKIRVVAYTQYYYSESSFVVVKTKTGVPGPPEFVSVPSVNSTSAVLTWSKPRHLNGPPGDTLYKVEYQTGSAKWKEYDQTRKLRAVIIHLHGDTDYKIRVVSCNNELCSSPVKRSTRTSIGVPTAVRALQITPTDDASIVNIHWELPEFTNGEIEEYHLSYHIPGYRKQNPINFTKEELTISGNKYSIQQFKLPDCEEMSKPVNVNFTVAAVNSLGYVGPPSSDNARMCSDKGILTPTIIVVIAFAALFGVILLFIVAYCCRRKYKKIVSDGPKCSRIPVEKKDSTTHNGYSTINQYDADNHDLLEEEVKMSDGYNSPVDRQLSFDSGFAGEKGETPPQTIQENDSGDKHNKDLLKEIETPLSTLSTSEYSRFEETSSGHTVLMPFHPKEDSKKEDVKNLDKFTIPREHIHINSDYLPYISALENFGFNQNNSKLLQAGSSDDSLRTVDCEEFKPVLLGCDTTIVKRDTKGGDTQNVEYEMVAV